MHNDSNYAEALLEPFNSVNSNYTPPTYKRTLESPTEKNTSKKKRPTDNTGMFRNHFFSILQQCDEDTKA